MYYDSHGNLSARIEAIRYVCGINVGLHKLCVMWARGRIDPDLVQYKST